MQHGGDGEVRDEADGGQRLAAEAQCVDGLQVLERAKLRRRVSLAQDGQVRLLRTYTGNLMRPNLRS